MEQPKRAVKKNKKKRRKRKSSQDESIQKALQQLKARYGASNRGNDDVLQALFNVNTKEVCNPSSYDRAISRAVESQLNRLAQAESPDNVVESVWLCALCQKQSCWEGQGDLFGPYFVELPSNCKPPRALLPSTQTTPAKSQDQQGSQQKSMDLWFHGQCALWAPELYMVAGRFPKLDEFVPKYWSKSCVECRQAGASIPLGDHAFVHHPCAVANGYRMKELTFQCAPPR